MKKKKKNREWAKPLLLIWLSSVLFCRFNEYSSGTRWKGDTRGFWIRCFNFNTWSDCRNRHKWKLQLQWKCLKTILLMPSKWWTEMSLMRTKVCRKFLAVILYHLVLSRILPYMMPISFLYVDVFCWLVSFVSLSLCSVVFVFTLCNFHI